MSQRNPELSLAQVRQLQADLACRDTHAQQQSLRTVCPCRNTCLDKEVWHGVFHLYECGETSEVRNAAHHAIETLLEHAEFDVEYQELLEWLTTQGITAVLDDKRNGRIRRTVNTTQPDAKDAWRDVPRLLEELTCGDETAQNAVLRAACPCRNRRYDKTLWLEIFRTHEETDSAAVRDAAGHAIGTLCERARTDPRSQEVLRWIADQDITPLQVEDSIPVWQPNKRGNGLYIPRFEHSPRSRRNRRR